MFASPRPFGPPDTCVRCVCAPHPTPRPDLRLIRSLAVGRASRIFRQADRRTFVATV